MNLLRSVLSNAVFGWSKDSHVGDSVTAYDREVTLTFLSDPAILSTMQTLLKDGDKIKKISDDALIKICRQLDFFYNEGNLSQDEFLALATSLLDQSLWYLPLMDPSTPFDSDIASLKVPKVKFGKTGLDISIVTCGGMRLQFTWMTDSLPFQPNRAKVLDSDPQKNIKNCIRSCLALGINHFETARVYGTSEYQFVEALYELIQEGVVKREDFIFQTKLSANKEKEFLKLWNQSWANIGEKLGYIDLLGLHCVNDVDEAMEQSYAVCERLKQDGKIRHIGFSTHGTSERIMKVINTEKVSFNSTSTLATTTNN